MWFTGVLARRAGQRVESEHFTYTVEQDTGNDVLSSPTRTTRAYNPEDAPGRRPKYIDEHVAALEANGVTPDVWDVDAMGVPHDLGVLSHYAADRVVPR